VQPRTRRGFLDERGRRSPPAHAWRRGRRVCGRIGRDMPARDEPVPGGALSRPPAPGARRRRRSAPDPVN
jgi:hypothetical protein